MRALVAAALISACACGSAGHAPTARAMISPLYLPLGDGYRTDCLLDGSGSRDPIDDPDNLRPLRYAWTIDDPKLQITSGGLDGARLTVRLAADRPTAIALAVTDEDGDTGRAATKIGITIPTP